MADGCGSSASPMRYKATVLEVTDWGIRDPPARVVSGDSIIITRSASPEEDGAFRYKLEKTGKDGEVVELQPFLSIETNKVAGATCVCSESSIDVQGCQCDAQQVPLTSLPSGLVRSCDSHSTACGFTYRVD